MKKWGFAALVCAAWLVVMLDAAVAGTFLIADYDAEVRKADGRVDVPAMISRLKELRVTAFFFLIWHRDTDWDDLALFLPEAQAAGIEVWPYLVPPSESPPYTTRYSEPFRLDYVRWAEEIAILSLVHPNLKAFVIDDFWANRAFFTPDYVRLMRTRAQAINPLMTFWPLMYYREIDQSFIQGYRKVIDGVVAAYPRDEATIAQAWAWLNDRHDEPAAWAISYPGYTRSTPGDFAGIRKQIGVKGSGPYLITLKEQDDYEGPTAGYHFKQLLLDGEVVWEEDVAGGVRAYRDTTLNVTDRVLGKQQVTVVLRVFDKKGVSNFPVVVSFQDPLFEGFEADGNVWLPVMGGLWTISQEAAFEGTGTFRIPLIVMVAAERAQFVKRWGEPGSPERIRDKLKMALVAMRRGFAEGVVTYALYKQPGDAVYDAIRRLLLKASTSMTADFNGDGRVDFEDFLHFAQAYGTWVGENATIEAAFDLDLDGAVGFGDFLMFVRAYGKEP